ncbi:MAG: hypothetical protein E7105_03470 [Prevotella sp.]|nr:hypothetical protein [Prevotella sp.]
MKYVRPHILLICVLFMNCSLKAQNYCMTPSLTDESNNRRMQQIQTRSERSYNQNYLLKVYFHVIRKSDGTGGQNYSNVEQAFQILNTDYNPQHIYFVWNDSIDYIDNSYCYYTPSSSIFNYNNHTDGIDIYLYPDDISGSGNGLANGVGVSSEFYVAGKYWISPYPSLITSHVVSHEMGHVLYLWHTHHGTYPEGGNDNPCAELVNGSNSAVCGDYVMDTPADPHLHFNVNPNTYQWLGSGQDANGDYYQPDTRQIMSYTDIRCMTYFSSGQGERMRNAIEALPHLQAASVSIIGPSVPCGTSIYYVSNLPSNYSVTWSWKNTCSIPITQNSPYPNYCTITRDNSSYINNTLVATISKNGSTILTIEKVIDSAVNISGIYSQEAFTHPNLSYPAVVGMPFNHGDILLLHKGSTITLQSNSFIGATISRTGHTVHDWTVSGNTISFHFKYLPFPNIINPYNPNSVARPGEPASITITGQYPGTCEQFWFTVIGTDLPIIDNPILSLNLSVNNSGNDYTFSISGQTADATRSIEQTYVPTWKLIIVNTTTGQILFSGDVKDKSMTINTSEWGAGIYSARAIIGEEILTQKFIKK